MSVDPGRAAVEEDLRREIAAHLELAPAAFSHDIYDTATGRYTVTDVTITVTATDSGVSSLVV